jgi:hypothetical protein
MGFNISGIAVAKNLQSDIAKIEEEIGFKLEFIEEINFETASSNWEEDGICDIHFGQNGTLIFLSHELSMDSYSIMNLPTLTYAISETSMAFCFHYCENGKIRRSRAEAEGEELPGEGEILDIEYTPIDISEIIWGLIAKTIGRGFMEIDLADKAYRYRLLRGENIPTENRNNSIDSKPIGNRLKIPLLIFKYSKWVIIAGLIFTILSLTKIYDNRFGFLVIIFGVIMRRGSTWYMNNRMVRFKE